MGAETSWDININFILLDTCMILAIKVNLIIHLAQDDIYQNSKLSLGGERSAQAWGNYSADACRTSAMYRKTPYYSAWGRGGLWTTFQTEPVDR